MKFTIAKGNKRYVNALVKRLGMTIEWLGKTSLGYEEASVETEMEHSFHELISFSKSMHGEFDTIEDSIHLDLHEIDTGITQRKKDFKERYGSMFVQMKKGLV